MNARVDEGEVQRPGFAVVGGSTVRELNPPRSSRARRRPSRASVGGRLSIELMSKRA